MQKLFEGGKGSVFQRVLSWIPSHNHQLQLAGALAIANFARNGKPRWAEEPRALPPASSPLSSPPPDGNCIHMVDTGIVQKLLELLDRHVEEGNVTVQHAALSALRNLAIPGKPPPGAAGGPATVLTCPLLPPQWSTRPRCCRPAWPTWF